MMLQDTLVNRIPDCVLKHGEKPSQEWYPCVLKDPLGGSSIGVWICHNEEDLLEMHTPKPIPYIFFLKSLSKERKSRLLYLEGEAYPVVSIPKEGFFDLEAKYTKGKTEYIVPSPLIR